MTIMETGSEPLIGWFTGNASVRIISCCTEINLPDNNKGHHSEQQQQRTDDSNQNVDYKFCQICTIWMS